MTRVQVIVQEMLREGSAVAVLDYTTRMVGTYSQETMREIYLAAVAEREGGGKSGQRRRKAVHDISVAWATCTGQKPTASYNRTDRCERPTPFVSFAGAVFAAAGVEISSRTIRLDLGKRNHKTAPKVARPGNGKGG